MQGVKPIRGKGNRKHFAKNWKTTAKSVNKLRGIVYGPKLEQGHNVVLSHQKEQEEEEYMSEDFHKR